MTIPSNQIKILTNNYRSLMSKIESFSGTAEELGLLRKEKQDIESQLRELYKAEWNAGQTVDYEQDY